MVKAVTFKLNSTGTLYAVVKLTDTERVRIAGGEHLTVKVVQASTGQKGAASHALRELRRTRYLEPTHRGLQVPLIR